MKTFSLIPILIITLLCAVQPVAIHAKKTPVAVKLPMKKKLKKTVETEGHRVPPVTVWCDISRTGGVKVAGLSEDIISYEIRDISTEACMASFTEEPDFVDYVLSGNGEYQVILESDNYYITGNMATDFAELTGTWQFDNFAKSMGDGIEVHISGKYSFENNGAVHAGYRVITTMAGPATGGGDAKSVYLDLLIDGSGSYTLTDATLSINLDTFKKSYSIGEGTYDNMGPALHEDDPHDRQLAGIWFSTLATMLADRLKNLDITTVTLSTKQIDGSLMNTPVTLTRID